METLSSETNVCPIVLENTSANFQNIKIPKHDNLESWIVILLDTNTNERLKANENSIKQHCDITSAIKLFNCVDRCVDFLSDVHDEKICLILSIYLAEILVPMMHDIPQLKFIYILGDNENNYELQMNKWMKIKGSFSNIVHICNQFKQNVRRSEYDLISISTVSSSTIDNMNELDSSFMYSQLLKDILLKMQYDETAKADFVEHLRVQYANNPKSLELVNKFEQEYSSHSSILWYSKEVFIYNPLNRALRTQDTEMIVRMGFYIQDLHRQIVKLREQQQIAEKMFVYRGQTMTNADFKKLQTNNGGLLSFNNFLSTSVDKDVSYLLAESSSLQVDSVGIFFCIEIDPSISSTPFASLENISHFEAEQEILFSMHTIFRIDEIKNIKENIWQVNLTLTNDNDKQLEQVTEYMRKQIQIGSADKTLAYLLIRMGEYDKAEKICNTILRSTSDNFQTLINLYNMLGEIKQLKSDYRAALSCYQTILDMCPSSSEYDHVNLTDIYSNMAAVNQLMGDYSTASELYEIVVEIREKSLTFNSIELAATFNNMAVINTSMARYSIALIYSQKALNILESTLPSAHPDLAIIYNNIGIINNTIGERAIALRYFAKALEVQKKSLPPIHSAMAGTLNNLAMTYHWIGQYQTAIDYFQEVLKNLQGVGVSKHSNLAVVYNNIGQLYKAMGKYNEALQYYLNAIDIQRSTLPLKDPRLALLYINIGLNYNLMGDYFHAIEYLESALKIQKESLTPTHPELARTYNGFGMVYQTKEEYYNALHYYNKALHIQENNLSSTHPDLACIYNNIAGIELRLGHYQIALDHIKKVLYIQKQHLPPFHPEIARTYCNMGAIHVGMKELSEANKCFAKALKIQQTTLPPTHPEFGKLHNNIGMLSCMMGEYSTGLDHLKKARKILQVTLPSNHPDLLKIDENISKISWRY